MYGVGALVVVGAAVAAFVFVNHSGTSTAAAPPDGKSAAPATGGPDGTATPGSTPSATGSKAAKEPDFSKPGSGVFVTAKASGKSVGKGTVRRYKVQVEEGSDVSADDAAHEIESILGDPRGWTDDGHDAFQLVSSGSFDFEVKIASPDTVDRICGAAGLHTHGEVNCDVGPQVVVNLKRWDTGSPEFSGPIDGYRALIINHEVGHRIGHGHEGCPGPGKLAPVMMQQIDGLHGCIANQWPYDSNGHYIQGPPAAP